MSPHSMPELGTHRARDLDGLRTREEIALFVARQRALIVRAEREQAEQLVRHLRIGAIERIVFLIVAVAILTGLLLAAVFDRHLLISAVLGTGVLPSLKAAMASKRGAQWPSR
jgi:hypothetical protein